MPTAAASAALTGSSPPPPPPARPREQGGKEAARSNAALHALIVDAVAAVAPSVGRELIGLVTTRDEIDHLLKLHDVIDLVIPRGSNQLVRRGRGTAWRGGRAAGWGRGACAGGGEYARRALSCSTPLAAPLQVSYIQRNTKIPVLGHADGICHIYVDAAADDAKAARICVDAKADYPAACNAGEPGQRAGAPGLQRRQGALGGGGGGGARARGCPLPRSPHPRSPRPPPLSPLAVEKVLVHDSLAGERLQQLMVALRGAGVTLHGDERAAAQLGLPPAPSPRHEYGTLDLTLELVGGMDEAIEHIHANGSGHTECIITGAGGPLRRGARARTPPLPP